MSMICDKKEVTQMNTAKTNNPDKCKTCKHCYIDTTSPNPYFKCTIKNKRIMSVENCKLRNNMTKN